VPTKHENGQYASFYAFGKKFSKCEVFQRSGGRAATTNARGEFVDTISTIAICVHPQPMIGCNDL
jgi:hypothetical protein